MVYTRDIRSLRLGLVKAWEPFHLDELVDAGRKTVETEGPDVLNWPTIFDMREVDLLRQDANAFKSLFLKRKNISPGEANNAVAFVARNEAAYGMLRMYAAYAELSQVRKQDRVHICFDLDSAFAWIQKHLDGVTSAELDAVRDEFACLDISTVL